MSTSCQPQQAEGWEPTEFPVLKEYISAFKNLSTIQLVYRLSEAPGHPSRLSEPKEVVWNDLKGVAISQLENSYTDGPKKLKTVVLWVGENLEPNMVEEEIAVYNKATYQHRSATELL